VGVGFVGDNHVSRLALCVSHRIGHGDDDFLQNV
jgi:hypothetical protein